MPLKLTPERKVLLLKIGIGLAIAGMLAGYGYVWVKWVELEAARETALYHHNFYRSRHGSPPLKRSADLDMLAQMCADYYRPMCKIDHSCPYYKHGANFYFEVGIGENGFGVGGGSYDNVWSKIQVGGRGTWALYKEIFYFNFSDYKGSVESMRVLHFTQLTWRESKKFGFGYTTCTADGTAYNALGIFMFYPSGNVMSDDSAAFVMNVKPVLPNAPRNRGVKPGAY